MRFDDVVPIAGVFLVIAADWNALANSALLIECPANDVSSIRQQAFQLEFALILYYVSWCRESRAAKDVYSQVARHYQDEIHFAAVDCWHLECNCSRTIPATFGSNKGYPQKWPTLIVHYGRQLALQYHDEWKISALTRFVGNLLRPVLRLNSKDDLKSLNMRSNAVLLGLFENATVPEYQRFTIAALKWLENDPQKVVVFSVCFGAAANDIVKSIGATMPLIVLVTDREIEVFNFVGKWKSNQLNLWLQTEIKKLSKHFMGYSTPPLLLEHVRKGPVLAIFASDSKHSKHNFYKHMLGLFPPTKLQQPNIKENTNNDDDQCFNDIKIGTKSQRGLNHDHNRDEQEEKKGYCEAKLVVKTGYYDEPFNKTNENLSKLYLMQYQPSVQLQANTKNSAENLLKFYRYNEHLKVHYQHNIPELQTIFAKLLRKIIEKISKNSITRFNRTMSVQIMDTSKYHDILRTLGDDTLHFDDSINLSTKTKVLIIEPNQEGVYIMQKTFSYEFLLGFIKDYYNDNLYITRKTGSVFSSSSSISSSSTSSSYILEEVNRIDFLNRIQHFWENTTTILLLYTPRCAFSAMLSHTLIQISAMLREDDIRQLYHINMIRLNIQTNDLPWEFVTPLTPALIVLPRGRPSESRIFPSKLKINVRNVFSFILAQLEPIEQVRVALGSCGPNMATQQLMKCLHFARTLAMQHINDHLKLWQIFENERNIILSRLKQFKDITLDIQERFLL